MEMASKLSMMDVFVGIRDPRQAKKVEHEPGGVAGGDDLRRAGWCG